MPLVPDVLDEITALAQRKLEAVGLKVGTISTEKNPGGIPGTVLRTSPDLGSSVPEGSAVDLVIIEAADALAVPNVVGLSQPNAEQQIKQAGLRVRNVFTEETINSPAGNGGAHLPRCGWTSGAEQWRRPRDRRVAGPDRDARLSGRHGGADGQISHREGL